MLISHDKQTRLSTLKQIGIAAFLAGPFAGLWLMANNYQHFGDLARAHKTRLLALVAGCLALALALLTPKDTPGLLLSLLPYLLICHLAKRWQGNALSESLERGASTTSLWSVAGLILLVAFINFTLILGITYLSFVY